MKHINKIFPALTLFAGIWACNKSGGDALTSPPNAKDSVLHGKKVLLVMVDGLVGSELEAIAPPNIANYTQNAIYSYDAINSYQNDSVSSAYGWASILTGVNVDKHQVTTGDFTGADLARYPSITSRLSIEKPQLKIALVATKQNLADRLLTGVTDKFVVADNDLGALEKAKEILKTGNPDFVITQFSSPDSAGSNGEYLAGNSSYRAAVMRVDAYIGALVNTLQSRPGFQNEDWMVVVASGKGSNTRYMPVGSSWNAFDDKMHNTFIMYYNPRFVSKEYARPVGMIPYIGSMPTYTIGGSSSKTNPTRAIAPNAGTIQFDNTNNTDYTIHFKFNNNGTGDSQWPSLITNGQYAYSPVGGGFTIYTEQGYGMSIEFFNASGGRAARILGPSVKDADWHTIDIVFKKTGASTRAAILYKDGVYRGTQDSVNISSAVLSPVNLDAAKFIIGFTKTNADGSRVDAQRDIKVTDVRIYNTALPLSYLSQNYCKTTIDNADPYRANLMAFWPSDDVVKAISGTTYLRDRSGNGKDLILENAPVNVYSGTSGNLCPTINVFTYRSLMNTVDVSYQIYTWLGISPTTNWGLDGKALVPNYINVSN